MKPQLHVSGLLMLEGCGEQYRRRYIEGEKVPPSGAIVRGIAVDHSANADLKSKKDTGELLAEEQVLDLAADMIHAKWAEGVQPEEGVDEGGLVDTAVSMAGFHHAKLAPQLEPLYVQRSWTLAVSGLPVDLVGTIDVQEIDSTIRDLKTGSKSPNQNAAHVSLQLTTYALAHHVIDKMATDAVHQVRLDHLVRTPKRGDLKLVQLQSTRDKADFDPFLERVMSATRALESGVFIPARPDDWRCSEKFCGYWRSCRYAMRPKNFGTRGTDNGDSE